MNQNKKIIILLGVVFSIILLGLSVLKISINVLYPENVINELVKESFREIFGKAVKFDSLYFKYNGNIVLNNFYLSNKSDFNDNINLVKCQEVIIDTFILDLIRKKVTFSGVYMVEPEITIIKNYGKTYYETFIEELVGEINRDKMLPFIKNGFRLELTDSTLSFRETFRNSKNGIDLYNLDIKIKYRKDSISYRSYGTINDKNNNNWFRKGSYKIKGEYYFDKKYSDSDIELKNFNLSYLNNLLNESFSVRTYISGLLTCQLEMRIEDGKIRCSGSKVLTSLDLVYLDKESPVTLIKNLNIDTNFDFYVAEDFKKFEIGLLEVDLGAFKLKATGDFADNDYLSLNLKTGKIDFDELSQKVFIFKSCSYSGNGELISSFRFKLDEKRPENLDLKIKLNRFNITPINQASVKQMNIKDCNLAITANKERVDLSSDFKSLTSDFKITFSTLISNWNPLKSSSNLELYSKRMDLIFLKDAFTNSVKGIYNLAYVDMFQNFDEQKNFLKEPEGIFANNNDISFRLNVDKLFITDNSYLEKMNFDISLQKGVIKTNNFSLTGFGGSYSLNLNSFLKQEFPFFKFTAEVKDMDLAGVFNNSGPEYTLGGQLSASINFETSAYRIGQVIENGKAGINISIKNGSFRDTEIQKKINSLLKSSGFSTPFSGKIDFSTFTFSFMQSANSFYIKNFMLDSPAARFNCYGSFTEEDGLKVPVNLTVIEGNNYNTVPLDIYGNLEAPCVRIKTKDKMNDKAASVCF